MTIFVPPSQLLIATGDSKQAQKLILSSGEWLDLQNRVQAVLALPTDFGEYQDRYGDASSGVEMKECFEAMHGLQTVAGRYGNPKLLREKILQDPNFLAHSIRPKNDIYSATTWTLERAHQNAFSLASLLKGIPANAQGTKPSETVVGIKSLFLDTDQIVDKMQLTVNQFDLLIGELQSIENELDTAQQAMRIYTSRSSKTRTSLDLEIGSLAEKIAELEKARDAAYNKWLALTISACVVPAVIGIAGIAIMVLLSVPTGGGSFAVGSAITGAAAAAAAGGLGAAAGVASTTYNDLVKEVSTTVDFRQKRIAYRHDLGALDELMRFSLPNSSGIISQVRVMREAWSSTIQEIRYKVNDLTVGNLADGPWLNAEEMASSAANWTKVDDAIKGFLTGSFVDSNLLTFGDALPQSDAEWQQRFVYNFAA